MLHYKYLLVILFSFGLNLILIAEEDLQEDEALNLLYKQIGILELEIKDLRSKLEEVSYSLERLEDLNQQRYIDMDRRLYELSIEKKEKESSLISSKGNDDLDSINEIDGLIELSTLDSSDKEILIHKRALELFDEGRFSDALSQFEEQIISYPEGQYTGHAFFWLGELFLVQNRLADSRESYLKLVENFEGHSRHPDALYKLGEIARIDEDKELAIEYYNKVISCHPNTAISLLAIKSKEKLEEVSN